MLTVSIEGNVSPVKKFMKIKRAEVVKEIEGLEKGIISVAKLDKKYIERNVYSVSKTLPARYDNIVINALLLERFLKKLDRKVLTFEKTENSLLIKYEKGEFELFDISRYFEDIADLPTVVLV